MDTMNLYAEAKKKYAQIGINTDSVITEVAKLSISINCNLGEEEIKDNNIHVDNIVSLREDMEKALALIPGMHRINIDAKCYITNDIVSLDEILPMHFDEWSKWGRAKVKGIDITSNMSNHEMADTGYTLSSEDKGIRYYWIEHAEALRRVGEKFGRELITPSYVNIRIFDEQSNSTIGMMERQKILTKSLDRIYNSSIDDYYVKDIISGITDESGEYPVASELLCHQYARKQFTIPQVEVSSETTDYKMHKMISNASYFSNTFAVNISPKKGEKLLFVDESIQKQIDYIIDNDLLESVQIFLNLDLDKKNRIKQWVISTRSLQRAIMRSLLMPKAVMDKCNEYMKNALTEEFKSYPMGAVWDYFCLINEIPGGINYLEEIK